MILLGPNLCRWRALAKGGERNAQTFVYGTDRSGMIGCLCTGTGAVDESNVVSKEYETTGTAIIRATRNLDWTIKANGTVVADTSFTMSAGETVWIRANYSPENASLDFGLVDSNEKFHYINVTTGSIDKTIEIPENGDYTLAIRNNSSKSVKVTGVVRY